jgi:hypothetical protein
MGSLDFGSSSTSTVATASTSSASPITSSARTTPRREWQSLSPLLHRAERFNGADVYSWVAGCGVPAIASGDTHRREQVSSWKTLLPCGKDEEEIVAFLRSPRSAYLVPFRAETAVEPAAAA